QLGVLLYELLTGRRPYQLRARAVREIERLILEQEPTRPSTVLTLDDDEADTNATTISAARASAPQRLQRQLRGDLDQIVLKALQKEASRRYGSAEAMAGDVARHLQGLPVLAQPDEWTYRAKKFIRRHRAALGALSLTVASLAVGLGLALWQGHVAAEQRDAARQQQRLAANVSGFMKDMFFYFASVLPEDISPTPLEVLQQGVVQAKQLEDDPEVAGAVLHEVADLHIWVQALPQADALFQQVLDLRTTQRGKMSALERLATSARLQGDLARARPLYEQAVAIGDKHLAPDDPDLAFVLNTYAISLEKEDDMAAAEAVQRRVVAIRETQSLKEHTSRGELAIALDNLAVILGRRGDPRGALEMHTQAFEHRMVVDADTRTVRTDVPWSLYNILSMEVVLGLWPQAEERVALLLPRADSALGRTHSVTVGGRRLKALLMVERGDLAGAEALVREARADNAENPYPDQDEARGLTLLQARIDRERGQPDVAERSLRELWSQVEGDWEDDGKSPRAGPVAVALGRTLLAAERPREAIEWLSLGLEIEEATWPSNHYRIGTAHLRLAEAQQALGATDQATHHAQQALALLEPSLGEEHPHARQARALL
ncbi:MAG: tetratricopeptide repeat protein, partial [Pseudomonadota bacterium]